MSHRGLLETVESSLNLNNRIIKIEFSPHASCFLFRMERYGNGVGEGGGTAGSTVVVGPLNLLLVQPAGCRIRMRQISNDKIGG
jgi:hypothetical protein